MNNYLNLSAAADYLGIKPGTLRQYTNKGLVKAWTTSGKHRRYSVEELNKYRNEVIRFGPNHERLCEVINHLTDEQAKTLLAMIEALKGGE